MPAFAVADGLARADRRLQHAAAQLRRDARARAPPRRSSGGAAAPSSRARRAPRRGRRPGPGSAPRRAGPPARTARSAREASPKVRSANAVIRSNCARDVRGVADDSHAQAAAARGRLQHHRVADRSAAAASDADVRTGSRCRGRPAPRRLHQVARVDLVAHLRRSPRRRGPTHTRPASRTGAGELGVLGEEPVAGMNRPARRSPAALEDPRRCSGRLGRAPGPISTATSASRTNGRSRVRVGVHGDGLDPHDPGGPDHSPGDLATVGHQQRCRT